MAGNAAARDAVFALRRDIARIEGRLAETLDAPSAAGDAMLARRRGVAVPAHLATGAERFDAALGGGIPAAGLSEIHGRLTRDAGAVCGFALALAALAAGGRPVVWIASFEMLREAGDPYLPGVAALCGIGAGRLLTASAAKPADVLWIAEEAASLASIGAILLELRGNPPLLDLTATRRLHRRALAAGRPLFLLRHGARAEPTAAPLRLLAAPAPAALRRTLAGPLHGSIGQPGVRIVIDKNRLSPQAAFLLHWNAGGRIFEENGHEPAATDTRPLAAPAADRPDLPAAAGEVMALRRRTG
jgi:protein ImuA